MSNTPQKSTAATNGANQIPNAFGFASGVSVIVGGKQVDPMDILILPDLELPPFPNVDTAIIQLGFPKKFEVDTLAAMLHNGWTTAQVKMYLDTYAGTGAEPSMLNKRVRGK